jgi:hypothetical protein
MTQLINEAKRFKQLAGILTEAVEVPTWLAGKLEDVHVKPGQGSIFAKSISDVLKLAQDALDKEQNIDKIANSTGTLTIKSPGIGYNLVLPIDKAKALPDAKESEVEKIEGPNKVKVPAITTTAPLTQFKTDDLTVIVRPKKDESGAVIPNEYIVLSAFPGDPSIPRASEWDGKYAVIIPGGKAEISEEKLSMAGNFKVGDKFKMRGQSNIRTIKKIEGNKIFIEDENIPGRLFQWDADGIDAEIKTGKLRLLTPTEESLDIDSVVNEALEAFRKENK